MIHQSEVVQYLLKRELITAESIVEGDFVVEDASRRNRNYKIIRKRGPCYFLKQGVGLAGRGTVAHEAAVYQFLQSGTANGLDSSLPNFYGYDPDEHVLILELLPEAQNLREYYSHRQHFSTTIAGALGNTLGTIHSTMPKRDGNCHIFEGRLPWVLSIHRPDIKIFRDVSSGALQVIRIVQQSAEFCKLLDGLRQDWKREVLINFDIKWDNWIICEQSATGRKTRLKVVDWELSDIGDPCWDIGSVFNDYLGFWLLSIPITGETPPDQFLELAQYPLDRMQPALRAFWRSYVRRMELDSATADEWLLRAIKYSAARLVQMAFELMRTAVQVTGSIVCFLQLSLNILQWPQETAVQLLGIPLQGVEFP